LILFWSRSSNMATRQVFYLFSASLTEDLWHSGDSFRIPPSSSIDVLLPSVTIGKHRLVEAFAFSEETVRLAETILKTSVVANAAGTLGVAWRWEVFCNKSQR
jgi:hypothetical protein